jgi:hypothetical protein
MATTSGVPCIFEAYSGILQGFKDSKPDVKRFTSPAVYRSGFLGKAEVLLSFLFFSLLFLLFVALYLLNSLRL